MGQLMRSIGYTLNSLDRRFQELESVSSYDFLTDLHNRRSAKSKLNNHKAHSTQSFMIMLDLNNLNQSMIVMGILPAMLIWKIWLKK